MREKLPDISPEQLYGVAEVKAPEGFEFTGKLVDISKEPWRFYLPHSVDAPILRLELRKKPVRWVPAKGEGYWSTAYSYVTSEIRGGRSVFTEPAWKTQEHAEEFRAALNKLADEFQNRFYGEGK